MIPRNKVKQIYLNARNLQKSLFKKNNDDVYRISCVCVNWIEEILDSDEELIKNKYLKIYTQKRRKEIEKVREKSNKYKTCIHCKKKFQLHPRRPNQKFCNRNCYNKFKSFRKSQD